MGTKKEFVFEKYLFKYVSCFFLYVLSVTGVMCISGLLESTGISIAPPKTQTTLSATKLTRIADGHEVVHHLLR